jgi:hypothetical protein
MVNSTANINKTNNHLSPKESLNSDGQQYRQYPQNEQPPLTSNHWTLKKKRQMALPQKCDKSIRLIRSQLLLISVSPMEILI